MTRVYNDMNLNNNNKILFILSYRSTEGYFDGANEIAMILNNENLRIVIRMPWKMLLRLS